MDHDVTTREPTFYKICWDQNQAIFEEENCKDAREAIWTRKHVRYAFANGAEVFAEDTRVAVKRWNEIIGYDFFVETKLAWDVMIFIDQKPFPGRWAATGAYIEAEEMIMTVGIDAGTKLAPNTDLAKLVLLHELGHVLGLDHDPNNRLSIMFPYISPDDSLVFIREISNDDAAALRNRYSKPGH